MSSPILVVKFKVKSFEVTSKKLPLPINQLNALYALKYCGKELVCDELQNYFNSVVLTSNTLVYSITAPIIFWEEIIRLTPTIAELLQQYETKTNTPLWGGKRRRVLTVSKKPLRTLDEVIAESTTEPVENKLKEPNQKPLILVSETTYPVEETININGFLVKHIFEGNKYFILSEGQVVSQQFNDLVSVETAIANYRDTVATTAR